MEIGYTDTMKIVYRAANLIEANLVKGLLESEGIHAVASGDYLQGGMGEIPATGLNTVLVNTDDYTKAKNILKNYEAGEFAVQDPDPLFVEQDLEEETYQPFFTPIRIQKTVEIIIIASGFIIAALLFTYFI